MARTRALFRFAEPNLADRPADALAAVGELRLHDGPLASPRRAYDYLGAGDWNHAWRLNEAAGQLVPAWGGVVLSSVGTAIEWNTPGVRPDDSGVGIGSGAFGSRFAATLATQLDAIATTDIAFACGVSKLPTGGTGFYIAVKSSFGAGQGEWYVYYSTGSGQLIFSVSDAASNTQSVSIAAPAAPFALVASLDRNTQSMCIGVCPIAGQPSVSAQASSVAVGSLTNTGQFLIGHGDCTTNMRVSHMMLSFGRNSADGMPPSLSTVVQRYAAAIAATPQIVTDAPTALGRSFAAAPGNVYTGSDAKSGETALTRDATVQALVKWDLVDQVKQSKWTLNGGPVFWDAYARGNELISGDFALEMEIAQLGSYAMIGVRPASDASDGIAGFTRFMYMRQDITNGLSVFENSGGVYDSAANFYQSGDQLRITRTAGVFRYYHRRPGASGSSPWTLLYTGTTDNSDHVVYTAIANGVTVPSDPFINVMLTVGGAQKEISWSSLVNITATPTGNRGTLYARGLGGSIGEALSLGVELRAMNATQKLGEIGFVWQDSGGSTCRQLGGSFTVPDGYTLITATRRWESTSKVVLRYYVGADLVGEVTSTDGDIAGGTGGTTQIGGRQVGAYPRSAAAMARATRSDVTWTSGYLFDETSGNIAAAWGGPSLTPVSSPLYAVPGPRAAIETDNAVSFDSVNDAFTAGVANDPGAGDLVLGFVVRPRAVAGDIVGKVDTGLGIGFYLSQLGSGQMQFVAENGATILSLASGALRLDEWYAGLVYVTRGQAVVGMALRSLSSGHLIKTSTAIGALGTLANGSAFKVGDNGVQGGAGSPPIAFLAVGVGVGAAGTIHTGIESAIRNFTDAIGSGFGDFFDGSLGGLRVCDYEMSREEIEATWLRITKYEPDGYRMIRDLFQPGLPISDDPTSKVQGDLRSMGAALGYGSAQIENVRANMMPDRAYGEVLERWEHITQQAPKPLDSLDRRRTRVVGHLAKRAGVSLTGVKNALEEVLDTDAANLSIIAFDNTIRDTMAALETERWRADSTQTIGASVSKTGGVFANDHGARASEEFYGDCWIEFPVLSLVQTRYVGLTSGSTVIDPATFDFAIRYDVADYTAWELGVQKQFATGLALNDVLRIERRAGVVTFRRNGIPYYVSPTINLQPLRLVVAVATVGGSVPGLRMGTGFATESAIRWEMKTGATIATTEALVSAHGARLLVRSGGGTWTHGASSVETIAGDGYVEIVVDALALNRMVGFSFTDPDQNYTSIGWALQLSVGAVGVWESNTSAFTGPAYAIGDVFRVERVGTVVYYKKNGTVFYTSTKPCAGAVLLDTSLNETGAALDGIRLFNAGTRIPITWQNVVGCEATSDSLRMQSAAPGANLYALGDGGALDAIRAVMTVEPTRSAKRLGGIPGNTLSIFASLDPILLPSSCEAGLMFWDWQGQNLMLFGVRNTAGAYSVGYQRYRADAGDTAKCTPTAVDAAWQTIAATTAVKHWLRIRPAAVSVTSTIYEQTHELSYSTTGTQASLEAGTTAGVVFRGTIGWVGYYLRTFGSPGAGQLDVRFGDVAVRNADGTRPYYWYAIRDAALPGSPDWIAGREIAKRMRHAFTWASVAARRSFLCDDPLSVCDAGPLGGI